MATEKSRPEEVEGWRLAPIIVGGTQGSGTRGVQATLQKMGIFMHAEMDTWDKYKSCYNWHASSPHGHVKYYDTAMDNSCMDVKRREDWHLSLHNFTWNERASSPYTAWLYDGTCPAVSYIDPPRLNDDGQSYMSIIPPSNRAPHRWGWKIPKTMWSLHALWAVFPNMIFVHTLRNPLDMAASYLQHLPAIAFEFNMLHGGHEKAARVMEARCSSITGDVRACAVPASKLQEESSHGYFCDKNCHPDEIPSSAWSCLHAMVWAESNRAVRQRDAKLHPCCVASTMLGTVLFSARGHFFFNFSRF